MSVSVRTGAAGRADPDVMQDVGALRAVFYGENGLKADCCI